MINVSDYMGYVQLGMAMDRIASFQKGRTEVNAWGALQSITTSSSALRFHNSLVKFSAHTEAWGLEEGETLNWRTGQSCQHLLEMNSYHQRGLLSSACKFELAINHALWLLVNVEKIKFIIILSRSGGISSQQSAAAASSNVVTGPANYAMQI